MCYIRNMKYVNAFATLPDAHYEAAADLLAALGHPVRLRIIAGLLDGSCCVGPMTECLGLPQPIVSKHLAILREAGLVEATVDGRQRRYTVSHPLARGLIAALWPNPDEQATTMAPRPSSLEVRDV